MILYADSDSIFFGLTRNLLCTFNICWVSTAVVIVKNDVMLLVFTRKVLELGFFTCFFNKSLIKCEKFISCLMQQSKDTENEQKPRCSSCIAIEPTISKFCYSSYLLITLHNLETFLSLLLLSHSTIETFTNPLIFLEILW